tara:strand:+ start:265 stop:498 length:234 start_codon:yes stop_codon:yes gene_type:complete
MTKNVKIHWGNVFADKDDIIIKKFIFDKESQEFNITYRSASVCFQDTLTISCYEALRLGIINLEPLKNTMYKQIKTN